MKKRKPRTWIRWTNAYREGPATLYTSGATADSFCGKGGRTIKIRVTEILPKPTAKKGRAK